MVCFLVVAFMWVLWLLSSNVVFVGLFVVLSAQRLVVDDDERKSRKVSIAEQ